MPATEVLQPLTLKQQREAMRDGRLVGPACTECGHRSLIPFSRCVNGHDQVRWMEFAREGVVVTYTIQIVAPEQFINEVPFAWVVVDLDGGGPRISGWIPFVSKPDDLRAGQRVRFMPSYKPGLMFEKVP